MGSLFIFFFSFFWGGGSLFKNRKSKTLLTDLPLQNGKLSLVLLLISHTFSYNILIRLKEMLKTLASTLKTASSIYSEEQGCILI